MSIIHEHQLIFIHTAKTAGTSISDYFNSERGHHNFQQYHKDLGPEFIKYKSFVVVRDPVDRFISAWNMVVTDPDLAPEYLETYPEFCLDLNEALQTDIASRLRSDPEIAWFWSQMELLLVEFAPDSSAPQVYLYIPTFVLFFDNLLTDFKRLCNMVSVEFDSTKFLHLQTSKGRWQKSDLNASSLEVIRKCYSTDYTLINKILSANALDPSRKIENPDIERVITKEGSTAFLPLFDNPTAGLFKVTKK